MSEAKRKLKGITFDFKGAELSYTSECQGGAASMMNDPILLKSNEEQTDLSDNQKKILEAIGEESTPLEKTISNVDTKSPTSVEDMTGVNNKKTEENTEAMADETLMKAMQDEVTALKKELAISKSEKEVLKYNLEAEDATALATAIADLKDASGVIKALDVLLAKAEDATAIAKEAGEKQEEENPLAKALEEEVGEDVAGEEAPMSIVEKAMAIQDAQV